METVIRVDHVGKSYRITRTVSRYRTLQEDVIGLLRRPLRRSDVPSRSETFWALQDISFEVKQGEVVGIIGRNGAGKSTLLKILSRITRPTTGSIDLYGRIGSLLEVGTGFHPELSGRENIFLNGAVLGMTRGEIRRKFDEIVAFAQVEQFLETPVKRYSSGMYMRLAFAVAAHLEPEILVVDEVLAVGDAEFQKKSLGKMSEVAQEGRTVLFVSHSMAAVESLCTRGIVLEHGQMKFMGTQTEAINRYLESTRDNTVSLKDRADRVGTGDIIITGIEFRSVDGALLDVLAAGQDVDLYFYYECPQGEYYDPRLRFSLLVKNQSDSPLFLHHNRLTRQTFPKLGRRGAFVCRIQNLPLTSNVYSITYSIMVAEEYYVDYLEHAAQMNVIDGDFFGFGEIPSAAFGPFLIKADWSTNDAVWANDG